MKSLHQHIIEKLLINKNFKNISNKLVDDIIMHLNIERLKSDAWKSSTSMLTDDDIDNIKEKLTQYIVDAGYEDFNPDEVQYRIPRKQGDDLPPKIKRRYKSSTNIPNDFNSQEIFKKGSFFITCVNKEGNPDINGVFLRIKCNGPLGGTRWAELIKNV